MASVEKSSSVFVGFFTLIELLVVIAIIAILAAMLMPALQQARERGRGAKCVSNLKQYGSALAAYRSDFRDYNMSTQVSEWWNLLPPYLSRQDMTSPIFCASVPTRYIDHQAGERRPGYYGWTYWGNQHFTTRDGTDFFRNVKDSEVVRPSKLFHVLEAIEKYKTIYSTGLYGDFSGLYPDGGRVLGFHAGWHNGLHYDGHTSSSKYGSLLGVSGRSPDEKFKSQEGAENFCYSLQCRLESTCPKRGL